MKRVLKVSIDIEKGVTYNRETRYTQLDKNTHYLELKFLNEDILNLETKHLKVNFIRPDKTVVYELLNSIKVTNEIKVPNSALEVAGNVLVEVVLMELDKEVLTVNELASYFVVETVRGLEVTPNPGEGIITTTMDLVEELTRLIATGKSEITNHTDSKKVEITNHTNTKKAEITTHSNIEKSEVSNTGNVKKQEMQKMIDENKVELDLLLASNNALDVKSLLGDRYKGVTPATIPGEIYYKENYTSVSLEIDESVASPTANIKVEVLTEKCKKFFMKEVDREVEFNLNKANTKPVIGFQMETGTLLKGYDEEGNPVHHLTEKNIKQFTY